MELPEDFPPPPSSLPERMDKWDKDDAKLFADYLYILSEEQREMLVDIIGKEQAAERKKELPFRDIEPLIQASKHAVRTTFEIYLKNREVPIDLNSNRSNSKER